MNGHDDSRQTRQGFLFALGAYSIWGLLVLYVKAVSHFPALEIVAYRAIWSVPVAGVVILALGRTADLKAAFRSPRTLGLAVVTASLISVNWSLYTWAVMVDRAVETALGYYINPLVNVLLGAVFLGERFTKAQTVAIGLAAIAVIILTVDAGFLPWISLSLAFSFGLYGYLRKTLPIGPTQGFFLEVVLMSIPAVIVLYLFAEQSILDLSLNDQLLLMLAGPITATPLILYAFGAKLLRYSTLGLMQYLAPTLIFLLAVFVFKEPFSYVQLIAFCFIWVALAVYSWSMIRTYRARPVMTVAK